MTTSKRFYTKFSYGNHKVIDRTTEKMVVGYSKKSDAEQTANGLNRLKTEASISKMTKKLQTVKGYGFYLKK